MSIYLSILIYLLLNKMRLISTQLVLDSQLKAFVYQLFTLFNYCLIKKIVLISLRKKVKNSQSKKYLKDILIQNNNIKSKLLSQLLTQQNINNFSFNSANNINLVYNSKLDIYFSENIISKTKKKILKKKNFQSKNIV